MDLTQIHTQYLDRKGYVRSIKLKSGIIIQTSPIIPFLDVGKIKNVDDLAPPKPCELNDLKPFAKDHHIKFTHKHLHKGETGLWFENKDIERGFVYVELTGKESVLQKIENAPLSWIPTRNKFIKSRLQQSIENARMAKHLQHLTLYAYSKFGEEWYDINEDTEYNIDDISDTLPPKTSSFWDKKVKVVSKEVLERLKMFIKTELFNDEKSVTNYKNRLFLPSTTEDTSTKKYLTFHSLADLRRWSLLSGTMKDEFTVHSAMYDCFYPKPYFYRKFGKTYLIQSVKTGKLRDAAGLIRFWNQNKINKGYEATFPDEENVDIEGVYEFDVSFELKLVLAAAKDGNDTVFGTAERAHSDYLSYNTPGNLEKSWWVSFVNYLLENTNLLIEDTGKVYVHTIETDLKLSIYTAMLLVE